MKTLCRFWLFVFLLTGWFLAPVDAQSATVIPTLRPLSTSAKRSPSKALLLLLPAVREHFVDFGRKYPHETFTGWIPKDSELGGGSTLAGSTTSPRNLFGHCELFNHTAGAVTNPESCHGARASVASSATCG